MNFAVIHAALALPTYYGLINDTAGTLTALNKQLYWEYLQGHDIGYSIEHDHLL